MSNKKRELYLDVLRIVASFLVIFNHTDYLGYLLFTEYSTSNVLGWFFAIVSVLTKVNVPLFFMISGVLMLNKEESLTKVLQRALKYVFIILIFSSLLYAKDVLRGEELNLFGFLISLINTPYNYTYYFLYSYIAYILMLPFLRILAKNMSNSLFVFLFVLCMIENVLHFSALTLGTPWINSNLVPVLVGAGYMIYPLFGYYIHYRLDKEQLKKYLFVLLPIVIFFLIVISYLILKHPESSTDKSQLYHALFQMLNSVCVFMIFRYFINNDSLSEIATRSISFVSSLTLGIYLLHETILHMGIAFTFFNKFVALGINKFIVTNILCLLVFIISRHNNLYIKEATNI